MKKWNKLDEASTPDGGTIALFEHDGRYTIRINGAELMSTRQHASEERLAELTCAHLPGKKGARILIGGLGFGFTLRAALAHAPADAEIVVAELIPAVIAWNRNPDYPLAADVLSDRRVRLVEQDVSQVLMRDRGKFDAIMLDVDNGPDAMSDEGNKRLYQRTGLAIIKGALRKGGVVGIWSAAADPIFLKTMEKSGFQVEAQKARAHTTSGGIHTLFIGRVR